MPILSAENSFKKGLAALIEDNHLGAAVHFREAIDIERQRQAARPTMRYLSYYGFCLAKAKRSIQEAIRACRTAALAEPRYPDLFLNLGRVYMVAGKHRQAREAFDRGLSISPDNLALQRERARAEEELLERSTPIVRSRSIRHWSSRMRKALRLRTAATP
jgi:tetratricopeptide (TPR) repeat protein